MLFDQLLGENTIPAGRNSLPKQSIGDLSFLGSSRYNHHRKSNAGDELNESLILKSNLFTTLMSINENELGSPGESQVIKSHGNNIYDILDQYHSTSLFKLIFILFFYKCC